MRLLTMDEKQNLLKRAKIVASSSAALLFPAIPGAFSPYLTYLSNRLATPSA